MSLVEPGAALSVFLEKHISTCGLCIDAMREMEAYVATSGDWPEGTHALVERHLRLLGDELHQLNEQPPLPF